MAHDITVQKLQERLAASEATIAELQAELALRAGRSSNVYQTRHRAFFDASNVTLAESEQRFRKLFDAIDDGVAVVEMIYDDEGEIVDMIFRQVNSTYERQGGIHDVIGRSVTEMLPGVEAIWLERYRRVAITGQPLRVEDYQQDVDRWFDVYFSRVDDEGRFVAIVFKDITDRKRAERVLHESEERQRFLLRLSDALRVEPSADDVAMRALQMLIEHMQLDRAYITAYRLDENRADLLHQIGNDRVPPLPTFFDLSHYPEAFRETLEQTVVIEDDFERPGLSDEERRASAALGMRAMVGATLRKGKMNPHWSMVAISGEPRRWTRGEIALVEEVAERTWAAIERARGESALAASEQRFQEFANASAAGLWIRDAETLEMEFASPAVAAIYGAASEAPAQGVQAWAATVVPEDRENALKHLETAHQGTPSVHEFRIYRPADGSFRWIRDTAFPLEQKGRVTRIGGIVEDVSKTRLAVEHQGVLLAELQHRVRNIMAMIRSIAGRTADRAASAEDYRSLLEGRLMALARVQVLLTREANAGGALRDIIKSELSVQAHCNDQFELAGPHVRLSPKAVEVLTMAFHELATNALKYGAFSVPEGRLRVTWMTFEKRGRPWLALDWSETGAAAREPFKRRGFGSDLIEGRIPYELGGTGTLSLQSGSAHCRLEFPLKDSESILETDAPTPVTVFGGTLDMTDAPDLTGHKILVVEDDYYTAGDTAMALRGAGAEVLGPCPSVDATLDLLETQTPTHAVIDLNLGGGGPRFEIAHTLKERGIPFLFMTGYDPDVIPAELEHVPRLQKPVAFRKIVEAVSYL